MTNKEWFKEAKFGMFIHWGLYSVLGGQWKHGPYYPYYGEWIQNRLQIPIKEYEPLTAAFNPIFFDAEEWVTMAKEAGMQYIVITSKHHDGFALFHSKVDPFNVVDATPFGRDIIRELADACKKHGIRFGLYYSQYVDWHEEHAGGWRADKDGPGKTWSNYWDFPDHSNKDFNIAWEKKLKPQLREILTEYGDIATLWCDTPYGKNEEESRMVYEYIKSVNPDVLVNTRVGNGYGDYTVMAEVNEDLSFYLPGDQGFNMFIDAMCIPTCCQEKEAAELFINFLCDPEISAANMEWVEYSVPSTAAKEYLDEETVNDPVSYPSDEFLVNGTSYAYLDPDVTRFVESLFMKVRIS